MHADFLVTRHCGSTHVAVHSQPLAKQSHRQLPKTPWQKHETRSSDAESLTFAPQHRYIGKLVPLPRTLHQVLCRRAYSSPLAILSGSFLPLSLLSTSPGFSTSLLVPLPSPSTLETTFVRGIIRGCDACYMDLVSTTRSSWHPAARLTLS